MDMPSPLALAAAVLTAPGWVRVGIAAPSERVREEAALALATRIVDGMEKPVAIVPDGQMALPFYDLYRFGASSSDWADRCKKLWFTAQIES